MNLEIEDEIRPPIVDPVLPRERERFDLLDPVGSRESFNEMVQTYEGQYEYSEVEILILHTQETYMILSIMLGFMLCWWFLKALGVWHD